MDTGSLLIPAVGAMRSDSQAGGYLRVDETRMPCQTGERTGRNHRAFMWEHGRPGGVVVFEFQLGRSRAGPREFLRGFRGHLQCEGMRSMTSLGRALSMWRTGRISDGDLSTRSAVTIQ
ncbi:MAG: transposase [Verrucomicrobiales bacterium]|nr:transposase [Verrucomicrobiales bacterium]